MEIKIQEIELSKLLPYAKNARTHSEKQVEQIAASIKEFGFVNPVLVNSDKVIIAGHGRVLAARLLKLEKVPAIEISHLSERQIKALVLADNRIAMNAGWDYELLSAEMSELVDLEFDVELTGFNEQEIDGLLRDTLDIIPLQATVIERPSSEKLEAINPKSKSKIVHTCPSCGEKFSS